MLREWAPGEEMDPQLLGLWAGSAVTEAPETDSGFVWLCFVTLAGHRHYSLPAPCVGVFGEPCREERGHLRALSWAAPGRDKPRAFLGEIWARC